MYVTYWRFRHTGHKPAWRQPLVADNVNLPPRISAPQKNFATAFNERIAIVRDRIDDMPDAAKEVMICLGKADDIRRRRQQAFADDGGIRRG